jgi:hypothetical protein
MYSVKEMLWLVFNRLEAYDRNFNFTDDAVEVARKIDLPDMSTYKDVNSSTKVLGLLCLSPAKSAIGISSRSPGALV